jgi:hypothetical protein
MAGWCKMVVRRGAGTVVRWSLERRTAIPETMKHAFMDSATERLICCVACADPPCVCASMHVCMFGHQFVQWSEPCMDQR